MKASLSMHSYSKLFAEILDSSVWQQELHVKVVWVTMLAMKSPGDQIVRASIPGLAKRAGVTLEQCIEALELFKAPDPYSRIKDFEGRRIEECREGWLILNGHEYQMRMSEEDIRAAWREQKRRERERASTPGSDPPPEPQPPGSNGRFQPPSQEDCRAHAATMGLPEAQANAFWHFYESKGWKVGKNPMKSWHSAMAGWKTRFDSQAAGGNGARSVHELRTVMSAKELLAGQIKDKYSSDGAMGATWNDETKHAEWKKLRGEIKALNEQIAGMA